jgi:hypothetical protein
MAARWQHERQLVNAPRTERAARETRGWLERRAVEARVTESSLGSSARFVRRLPTPAHPLYWLGLTTSSALAAQALATLIALTS